MAGFWHEPEWQGAGSRTEQQPEEAPGAGTIMSSPWHGWWHEGCPGI